VVKFSECDGRSTWINLHFITVFILAIAIRDGKILSIVRKSCRDLNKLEIVLFCVKLTVSVKLTLFASAKPTCKDK